jgi:penicillin-binding protein activator
MKINLNITALALVAALTVAGCNKRTVTRIDPDKQTDLSGRWNDTDSKLVAEELTKQCITEPWRTRHIDATKKMPVIIVGMIQNKSSEHIEAETFINDMQRVFINTGQVRVVQNAQLRELLRKERGDQQTMASQETQKKFGRELGADYMMFGQIFSTEDAINKKKAVAYQINLTLTNIETNENVWVGDKKIKKYITN